MDGDQANVKNLVNIAKKNNAWLLLDDAHSIGVIGQEGKGSASIISKMDYSNNITMATFGKAVDTKHDDYMTPKYAWDNIKHIIPKNKVIWEPF